MSEPTSAARPLAEAFTDADREFLREHRAVSVIEVHQDGSGSIRHWFVNVDQAEQIADLLGEPEQSTFAPPGSVQSLADITEGLPTL